MDNEEKMDISQPLYFDELSHKPGKCTATSSTLQLNKPWTLSKINRIDAGVHEIIFNVDGSPAIKLTVKGSFALEGVGVKSILTAA